MSKQATQQQASIVEHGRQGTSMKVEAGAGTGKTSTLVMLANAMPRNKGLYLAFNKSIATEAGRKFPSNFHAATIHSMAFRSVGTHYRNRIEGRDAGRLTPYRISQHYSYRPMKGLSPLTRAGLVKMTLTNFLASDRKEPGTKDLPFEDITRMAMRRNMAQEDVHWVTVQLAGDARQLWRDILDDRSGLPMPHDGYLKLWVDSKPDLGVDTLMLDEAQDASDLMLSLVKTQPAQLVLVGDRNQQIYEWRGAVNIMQRLNDMHTEYLSQSFRFDNRIAAAANQVLTHLDTPVLLDGFDTDRSTLPNTRAMLFRTNSGVFGELMERSLGKKQQHVHVAGGTQDLSSMLTAVEGLQAGRQTTHPDFIGFEDWGQYVEAAESYNAPAEMRLLVKVVENYPMPLLKTALKEAEHIKEDNCDISLSTAHKGKGREWAHVAIGSDFVLPDANPLCEEKPFPDEEARLQYVALTRAQVNLYGAVDMIKAYQSRNAFNQKSKKLENAPHTARLLHKLEHTPLADGDAIDRLRKNLDNDELAVLDTYGPERAISYLKAQEAERQSRPSEACMAGPMV